MTTVATFPDTPLELVAYLAPKFASYRFVTSLPGNVSQITVRIHRISGANRNVHTDRPIVDVDVFSPTGEGDASTAARAIQSAILSMAGTATMNGVVQRATTVNGPRWLAESNTTLVRYGATYELLIHAVP